MPPRPTWNAAIARAVGDLVEIGLLGDEDVDGPF
jgi:hypothetical protein